MSERPAAGGTATARGGRFGPLTPHCDPDVAAGVSVAGDAPVAERGTMPAVAAASFHNDTASVGLLDHRRDRLVLTGWNLGPG